MLGKLGHTPKAYQENRRHSFTLDGAESEIDTWPRIPSYLEIEADSRAELVVFGVLDAGDGPFGDFHARALLGAATRLVPLEPSTKERANTPAVA